MRVRRGYLKTILSCDWIMKMKRLIFPENSKNTQIKSARKNLPVIFFILSLAFLCFSLYKGFFLPLALSSGPPSNKQSSEQQTLAPFEQVVQDAQKLEGLFTLYRNQATNKVYLEITQQQLDKKFLCFVTLASGLGEAGILSGMPRLILAACVEDRPYLIGADETVRARSNRDLGRFLDGVFRGGAGGGAR